MQFFKFVLAKTHVYIRLRARNTFAQGEFSRQCFSESTMSGEYFGRLIATGECGVCLLYSCKVRYPQNKDILKKSLKIKILS